jgi:hypothetical protein
VLGVVVLALGGLGGQRPKPVRSSQPGSRPLSARSCAHCSMTSLARGERRLLLVVLAILVPMVFKP